MLRGSAREVRYVVVGIVMPGDGAPGRNASPCASSSAWCLSMTWIEMAPVGQAWTHAGASPAARRPLHMSHLRTIPRSALYCGTPYGHMNVQYWQPMHW